MRLPRYLSPSQISLWESNREEYYLQHLAEVRVQHMPQAIYMAIGSAFDAYTKAALHEAIFGVGANPAYEFSALFESQVEPQNRDWGLINGKYAYDCYIKCGAYDELLKLLQQSNFAPQFEFKIEGVIGEVPLLGKPDLRFVHSQGAHVILDWKCNGYCSKSATSPCKNYRLVRDTWDINVAKPSRGGAEQVHKGYTPIQWKGVEIHSGWLEDSNEDWANQLAIYSWMLGEEVGAEEVIVCIDQIVAKPVDGAFPLLRVANHRARISKVHQENLMARLKNCWQAITTGHIFEDMSLEESQARCRLLDAQAAMTNSEDEMQRYLNNLGRSTGYKR